MISTKHYDCIVLGGGALGLAAAQEVASRGATVALVEKRALFHDLASSGGDSRQFRIQYSHPEISQLALDSLPLWRELQRHTDQEILRTVGVLWLGDPTASHAEGQINRVTECLSSLDVPYRMVDNRELRDTYHFNNISEHWVGLFQKDGAVVNLPETLRVLHARALESGRVDIFPGSEVWEISPGAEVEVHIPEYCLKARALILSPGSYVKETLRLLGLHVHTTIWKLVSAYFKRSSGSINNLTWINFQDPLSGDDPGIYYGFPSLEWSHPDYVRVGANYPSTTYETMSEYEPTPDKETLTNISNWVETHMTGLDSAPCFPRSCVASLAIDPDSGLALNKEMIVDFVPGSRSIVVCATGWAGKFIPLLGKICADLALEGGTNYGIDELRFDDKILV